MQITLRNIQYHPNSGAVALLLEHELGAFFVNATQDELTLRTPGGVGVWGDAEALAAAQAGVDAQFPTSGYTVVLPPLPPEPPAPDPA
ncbi:MAG: hypothetical protein JWL95_1654 [Gemmatimonadetes bacterium]|nr:hypothetical protein [Gemmatimonadota bacterium]